MERPPEKVFEAVEPMSDVFIAKLGNNRATHPETVISAAARLAGTMLFRSFAIDTSKMEPGNPVLSVQANEAGPQLVTIVAIMLENYGIELDQEKLSKANYRGDAPKLTVIQMQELLEGDLNLIRERFALSLVEGAQCCALVAAWLIKECAGAIGPEVGFNCATYGFVEGSKTVPIPLSAKKEGWLSKLFG